MFLRLCQPPGRAFGSFHAIKRQERHSTPAIKLQLKLTRATLLTQAPADQPPGALWYSFPQIQPCTLGTDATLSSLFPLHSLGSVSLGRGWKHRVSRTCSSHLAVNAFQIRGFCSACRAVGTGQELRGIPVSGVLHLASFESIQAADERKPELPTIPQARTGTTEEVVLGDQWWA